MPVPRLLRATSLCWAEDTAAALTSAYPVFNVSLDMVNQTVVDNGMQVGLYLPDAPHPGGAYGTLNFSTYMRGAVYITEIPEMLLMEGCGMKRDTTGVLQDNDYTMSDPHFIGDGGGTQQLAFGLEIDGLYHRMRYAVGNCVADFTAGQLPVLNFSFTGYLSTVKATETTTATLVTSNLNNPVPVQGGSPVLGGVSSDLRIRSFTLDLGNRIALRPDVDGTYGFWQPYISDRTPVYTVVCEAPALATWDVETLWAERTAIAFTYTHNPTGAVNNACTISFTGYLREHPRKVDLDGILGYNLSLIQDKTAANALKFAWSGS